MNTQEILSKLHISELGQMQKDASDAVLHTDRDVVILAPTGSGKTLAYLLPLVQRLDAAIEEVQAVVIVPSRELALQSNDVFRSMGLPYSPTTCSARWDAVCARCVSMAVAPQWTSIAPYRKCVRR